MFEQGLEICWRIWKLTNSKSYHRREKDVLPIRFNSCFKKLIAYYTDTFCINVICLNTFFYH